MSEHVLVALLLLAVGIAGSAVFLLLYRLAWTGRSRSWMITSPPLLPVGKYWGLAPMAVASAALLLAMGCYTASYLSEDPAVRQGFGAAGTAVIGVALVAAIVLSWKLPNSWKPEWYQEWESQGISKREVAEWLELRQGLRRTQPGTAPHRREERP